MPELSLLKRTDLLIRMFGFKQIPLIYYTGLSIVEFNENLCVAKIPLNWRTKNHLGSMYFGAPAIGADVAGGLAAFTYLLNSRKNISVVFKDVKGEFLKRPDADVHFSCNQVSQVNEMMVRTLSSGKREEITVDVIATVPSVATDAVAKFQLTLSAKYRD
jgi:acyl-coenzyme A thioesterase PaaI-like protein